MKPIKIAMLSLTHGHSRKYFQTLRDNPKLEWVAVHAETENIKNSFLRSDYNIPCYLSEEQMFNKQPDIEAIVMASANSKHYQQFKMCARRGIHVLCMKIPTFDMEEYKEIMELVNQSNIVCQIELELHYNPVVQRIKDIVLKGELGKVLTINTTNITLSPVWAFPWQGDPKESYGKYVPLAPGDSRFRGGALCDHPHVFDLIRWLTNSEFDFVYAEAGRNLREGIKVEDNLLVNGKMKNGTSFLFDPSWSRMEERLESPGPGWEVHPKRMEVNVNIIGQEGELVADCFGPNVYHNGAPNDRYTVHYTYFDEWIGLMDEFADCVRNQNTPKINLEWHQRTIEAMDACYESISTERVVYF